ncbi:MAG: hypothetical protein AAF961_06890, partial [Planctomycetota bacterium]
RLSVQSGNESMDAARAPRSAARFLSGAAAMSTWFRASVMLAALIGLPAAWFNYGPLPPSAQGALDRIANSTRDAFGLSPRRDHDSQATSTSTDVGSFAPLFRQGAARLEPPLERATVGPRPPIEDMAAKTGERAAPQRPAAGGREADVAIQRLLGRLRRLGVADYDLQQWGLGPSLYRFECAMPLAGNPEHTQHFEAVASDPLASVEQVMAEVSSWSLARRNASRLQ